MKKNLFVLFILFISVSFAQTDNKSNMSSMFSAGAISVTIGGDFIVTGSYPALITERVDQFISRMYTEARERILAQLAQRPELLDKARKELENYSIRNITLKRTNGEESIIDLLSFRTTGDFANNPYLKNDDVLIFPPTDLERNFFSISGAINKPGKFHFRDGDKLSDAIKLAQGINKAYENVTTAEINRLSYDGENLETISVNLNNDYDLERGDRIVIVADETQKKEFRVLVLGEVKNPGEIPISKNSTSLKEVIEKAGGITESASLNRSRVFTGNTIPLILENLYGIKLNNQMQLFEADTSQFIIKIREMMLYRMSNVDWEDREYFELENQLRVLLEKSAVDFSNLSSDSSEASKYLVKDGDVIIIPASRNSVYVFGQVPNSGHIPFEQGMDFRYYISKAGGMGEFAEDEEEIMIIKGGTGEWVSPIDKKIILEEGDFVYVPRVPVYPFNYYVGQIANYLSIVGSAATVILLLVQFSK